MNKITHSDKKNPNLHVQTPKKHKEIDFLVYTIFMPPKYDTEFFYYTEVKSDWAQEK